MGVGPIPLRAIRAWCDGWGDEDAHGFLTCIRAMDAVYLEHSRTDKPKTPEKKMSPEMFDAIF